MSNNSKLLEGRVALITGAAQGIGHACALAMAESGASVVLGARDAERLRSVVSDMEAVGNRVMPVVLDVSRPESVSAAVEQAVKAWAKIDILVNNAAITRDNLLLRMKPEDWQTVLKTNLEGPYHCIRAVLPGMVKRRYGRIVNIASVVGQAGNAGQANYVASKAGLIGLTKAVAAEVASRNITVNAVAPGFVDTAMTQKLSEPVRQRILSLIPLQRVGVSREVAYAVRFLVSDEAAYITGHCLNVNGGMYMS